MSEDKRCETCRHWDNNLSWFDGDTAFCTKLSNGVIVIEGEANHPYAVDTPADFGCILHEPR